jgi:DNA mismatch endonuclease (patch repair protein)
MEKALRKKLPGGEFVGVPPPHSRRMGAVRGRGNRTTEARFRALLMRAGVRGWKLNPKTLAGRPDFFFPLERLAVFVDGCFWHGCPQCGHVPRVNRPFWKAKIERNRQRDSLTAIRLNQDGIQVLRFWEHELRTEPEQCMRRLQTMLGRKS